MYRNQSTGPLLFVESHIYDLLYNVLINTSGSAMFTSLFIFLLLDICYSRLSSVFMYMGDGKLFTHNRKADSYQTIKKATCVFFFTLPIVSIWSYYYRVIFKVEKHLNPHSQILEPQSWALKPDSSKSLPATMLKPVKTSRRSVKKW